MTALATSDASADYAQERRPHRLPGAEVTPDVGAEFADLDPRSEVCDVLRLDLGEVDVKSQGPETPEAGLPNRPASAPGQTVTGPNLAADLGATLRSRDAEYRAVAHGQTRLPAPGTTSREQVTE